MKLTINNKIIFICTGLFLAANILLPKPLSAAKFSIAVIPDTQWYVETIPELFEAQTQWIVDNRVKENIIYVAHLGDLKDDTNCDVKTVGGRTEWQIVDDALSTLEDPASTGLAEGIPYGIVPGNHDFDQVDNIRCPNYDDERDLSDFNTLFGPTRFNSRGYYGGSFAANNNEHNYTLFEFCGIKFIAINLSYRENPASLPPGDPELTWANNLLATNPDRLGIITSHFILEEHTSGGATNYGSNGANIYDSLSTNPNLFMILGAHRRGEAWRVETRAGMDDVQVLLSNYQDLQYPTGGSIDFGNLNSSQPGNSGFMRIMRFDTDTNQVSVETFAPPVPSLGRPLLISDNLVANGSAMDRFTASNLSFPFVSPSINPSVALLLDTSGSMSWGVDGDFSAPPAEQRITYAKEAAKAFLDMMLAVPANSDQASFGITTFPDHPPSSCASSSGEVVTSLISANAANISNATGATGTIETSPDLMPGGGTPLLAGVETANAMFGAANQCRSIVMLSDGYHNCPSTVTSTDPVVDTLISNLNSNNARLFTVGFGIPGDVDNLLHRRLADDTTPAGAGSQFYDVTADLGYDPSVPSTWTTIAKPALDGVFKEILSSVLGLETAIDPIGTVNTGETRQFEVFVNEHDRKIGFYLSWNTLQKKYLGLTVKDSNGQPVLPSEPGVKIVNGTTYTIMTVDPRLFGKRKRIGAKPWMIEINGKNMAANSTETFQYSATMNSTLKLHPQMDRKDYYAGDTITVTAQLTEKGKPIQGLDRVEVIVSAPEDGKGNWLSTNPVSTKQLAKIPAKKGAETFKPFQRKGRYLTTVAGIKYPVNKGPLTLPLFDDGSHGDTIANDGKYTNSFSDTGKEGIYSFYFKAQGPTRKGNIFNREQLLQKYLPVRTTEDSIIINIVSLGAKDLKQFDVRATPKDPLGNYLGPGHLGRIQFKATGGTFIGQAKDNLDGSYSQTLNVSLDTDEKDVAVVVHVDDINKDFTLADSLKSYGISFHLGRTLPSGNFGNLYDPGIHLGLDIEIPLDDRLTAVGELQYNGFDAAQAGLSDTHWLSVTGGIKYTLAPGTYEPFVSAGGGLYIPESGSTEPGIFVGAGVAQKINQDWSFEINANYNTIFTSNSNTKYSVIRAGLIYHLK